MLCAVPLFAANGRTVDAVYTATVSDLPKNAREVKVWVPLPVSREDQTISDLQVESPYVWRRGRDKDFGNEYLFTVIEGPKTDSLTVHVRFRAVRMEHAQPHGPGTQIPARELARDSRADRLVTLSPRIRKLADQITSGVPDTLGQARAIYNYVLATMTYDKTIPGWGRGDTERACDIHSGNCTDFHSLFISLARAKGIPARFIIGFPMSEKGSGRATGYHCWAEFYVKGSGWIPVDPAEASKSADPNRREFLFGNLDADRVEFTIGRDLHLDPPTEEPLNYFIYPYTEVDGKPAGKAAIALDYGDVPSSQIAAEPAAGAIPARQ